MVIINKAKAKVFRQTKKGFAKVFAVVLSMAVVVSTFAFSIPTASAKGESPFIYCEEIFIDMRSFTGWTSKSASFRVFTFYNDSDNPNWCHEYEGNFDNDGWYEGSNVLAKGIVPVKFCDNVYSFRIPSTKISHLRVVRTNSDGTEKETTGAVQRRHHHRDDAADEEGLRRLGQRQGAAQHHGQQRP